MSTPGRRSPSDPSPDDAPVPEARPPEARGPVPRDQPVDAAPVPAADAAPTATLAPADLWPILDAVPDPLFVVDRQWRFRFVNRATAESWGLDRDALVGRSLWSVHPQAVGSYPHQRLTEAMRDRRSAVMETFSPTLRTWVEASVYPLGDGLVIYHRDITRLRAAEEGQRALAAERHAREQAEQLAAELDHARELAEAARRGAERAHAQAEAAGRAKSDFLATMSHELRTPINAITGYTQLLELGVAGPVTNAQRNYLARLQTSGQHLLLLVDDVLDFAKIEAGRMVVASEVGATGRVVAAALGIIAPQAAARSIQLVDGSEGDEGNPFLGDEHRVRQILVNLLSNAVKFTAPGGTVTVRCAVATPPEGGEPMTTVQVEDTGVGIAPEHHARIFEPFVQVEGGRTRTAGGTGLGLAISRRLARLMGGDLTVESTPGAGAIFTLWLPAALDQRHEVRHRGAPRADIPAAAVGHAGAAVSALGEVGARLREHLEEMLDAFAAHVCADPLLEPACRLSRTQLENHALALVADVVQSLLAIDESQGVESELLRDGSAIQELIAFRHGEQRHRLGFTEDQLAREYDILGTELEVCARRRPPDARAPGEPPPPDIGPAIEVLRHLIDRARDASLRGHRHAARTSENPS